MTTAELNAAIASLGLTQATASKRWGIPYRTLNHWCTGKRRVPGWIEHVIRLESGAVQPLKGQE